MPSEIRLVPLLKDNYAYLLHDDATGTTAVVDPSESAPVLEALAAAGWKPDYVLNTHHHGDHIDGDVALAAVSGAPVVGPEADRHRIAPLTVGVAEGDTYSVGSIELQVFEVPGHTSGHIAFYAPAAQAVFSGDTLFALGCGRMFEGTAPQMWASMLKLRALPDNTKVYCGHEYTESNLRFALSIEPGNAALQARAIEIKALRAGGNPTIPSTIGLEKATNPFLRADLPEVQAAIGMAGQDPVAVFAEIRRRKDTF